MNGSAYDVKLVTKASGWGIGTTEATTYTATCKGAVHSLIWACNSVGECYHGMVEAEGSTPSKSTKFAVESANS